MSRRALVPAPACLLALAIVAPAPARAQFDFGAWMQRAQIVANQVAQLANDVRSLSEMGRQLTQLERQLTHMTQAARGELGALARPFADLAAGPVDRVGDRSRWRSDFSGAALETARALGALGDGGSLADLQRRERRAADRLDEAGLLELYGDRPPAAAARALADHRRARAAADRRRAFDRAALEAADALAATVESARASFAELTANANLSNTALQQATLAAALSDGRVGAAVAQTLAFEAAQRAGRAAEAEAARVESRVRWRESRTRANEMARDLRRASELGRRSMRDGLLLRVPTAFSPPPSE